jgi:hypothetical protein
MIPLVEMTKGKVVMGRTRSRDGQTAGPSTTLRSGRDDNSGVPQQARREMLHRCKRIVIPIGAPKDRSGGTCGFFTLYSDPLYRSPAIPRPNVAILRPQEPVPEALPDRQHLGAREIDRTVQRFERLNRFDAGI